MEGDVSEQEESTEDVTPRPKYRYLPSPLPTESLPSEPQGGAVNTLARLLPADTK